MKQPKIHCSIAAVLVMLSVPAFAQTGFYNIAGTGQQTFYGASGILSQPSPGSAFYGQDPQYPKNTPSYTDPGDGTITDEVTGLMWQRNMGSKITFPQALAKADTMTLGGYTDWRVPTIKELYSLILFTGREGMANDSTGYTKYIDTAYFDQPFGNTAIGERLIDAQTWSQNVYTGLTMGGDTTIFGVNFIDGRIKGYPKYTPGTSTLMPAYYRLVRGNPQYGINQFTDNGDGTVSDLATGLTWQQADDGVARDWEQALAYAEDLTLAGYVDWRLPDIKELQSIVDYSRCPQSTGSPAIDPVFSCTEITDPNGVSGQYPYYWSGTTHLTGPTIGDHAAYIAFGKAQGKMNNTLMDVHGAGSQRSDPKSGDASSYPAYFGPQGDVQYVYNYVRCVRTTAADGIKENGDGNSSLRLFPVPASTTINIGLNGNPETPAVVEIFNYSGQKVLTSPLSGNTRIFTIDIQGLPSGIYLLKVLSGKETYSGKFIRN